MLTDSTRMTDAEFRMLAELLRRHCGLHFGPESRFVFERRVGRRIRELEVSSPSAYHYLVRNDDSELGRLVDELTVNETYFFRERSQLRTLFGEILPELRMHRAGRNAGPIHVWSAGCSSGEEPYSLVMLALEAGLEPGVDLRVYASDISQRMLRKARLGVYREASFRETEALLRARYFAEKEGGWRICDDVKKRVDFIHLNLLDRSRLSLLGAMDVVLCRNVMIYFDGASRRDVIQTFYEKLRPGGHLLLGHSESLINLSSAFELRQLLTDMVYRRPLGGLASSETWQALAETAVGLADPEPTR